MITAAYLILIVIMATALCFGVYRIVKAYSRFRGPRTIICPETKRSAVVELDAAHAALTATAGFTDLRLENCSRWPMKAQCGQECLTQLDVAPGECLVSGVLMRWYSGKECVYCGKPFGELHWTDHRPALRDQQGKLVLWSEVPVETLSTVLETHLPVCWNCYIAQSFRLEHPELVVYRPWRKGVPGDVDGSSASRHL